MPPSIASTPLYNSTLCYHCRKLNLTATDFLVSEQETKTSSNPDDVYDPISKGIRAWKDVEETRGCPFCQIIRSAVEDTGADWLSSKGPHSCELKLTRLHGSYNSQSIQNDVRYLEVVANFDWNTSYGIELLPVESNEYPGCFPGRLVNPEGIGIERIRSWLNQCQTEHGELCLYHESPQFLQIRDHIIVFDVKEQCLVRLPAGGRYLALSYVWGNAHGLTTLKENIESLMVPNGLLPVYHQLPRVIIDAARFTEQLGERYLWVDALCIIQDDASFKNLMINVMNTIYENAYLTLFAATGNDSDAGLPGVRPTPRGRTQLTAEIADGLKLILPNRYENIKQSKWATRGWTYQEYFFSRRRLLFVNGQAIYRCSKVRWREDIAQEQLPKGLVHFQVDQAGSRTNWEPPDVRFVNAPRDEWSRYHFNSYVETYLDRDLTFDSDIISAFAGIINGANARQLPITWGLTEKFIGPDLLWLPSKWVTRRSGFPSWSWAGWKGPVICYSPKSDEIWQQRMSWIDWYIFDKGSGMFRLLSTGYAPQREAAITRMEDLERQYDERRKNRERGTHTEDNEDADGGGDTLNTSNLASLLWRLGNGWGMEAPLIQASPFPFHSAPAMDEQTLLFKTLTAHVSISSLKPNGHPSHLPIDDQLFLPSSPTLHLYAADGTHIGSAWPHTQDLFDTISSYDRDILAYNVSGNRLQIEIALLAGPLKGDWRSRTERATTWEYTLELAGSGLNVGSAMARYGQKMQYEQAIGEIYVDMVRERQAAENGAPGVENRLTVEFWEELENRVVWADLGSRFPGHCEETMRPVIDSLSSEGAGMRAKDGQGFIKVMLISNVSDGSSSIIKERVGMGEIRDNALGLIEGLSFRYVLLK